MNNEFMQEYVKICEAANEANNLKEDYKTAFTVYQDLKSRLICEPVHSNVKTGWQERNTRIQELIKKFAAHDNFNLEISKAHDDFVLFSLSFQK